MKTRVKFCAWSFRLLLLLAIVQQPQKKQQRTPPTQMSSGTAVTKVMNHHLLRVKDSVRGAGRIRNLQLTHLLSHQVYSHIPRTQE